MNIQDLDQVELKFDPDTGVLLWIYIQKRNRYPDGTLGGYHREALPPEDPTLRGILGDALVASQARATALEDQANQVIEEAEARIRGLQSQNQVLSDLLDQARADLAQLQEEKEK